MSLKKILSNPAMKIKKEEPLNEEWNNFIKRVGEVSGLVKDLASGDKQKAEAAKLLADKYLEEKVIGDEDDLELNVKTNRTVINEKAFKTLGNKQTGDIDKDAWMEEVSKDAEQRAFDRKVRREKADTFKTIAEKAFKREEYEKALSCYDKAIDQVKDNSMLYLDRALTNIKLGRFDKVFPDCDWALRLNEKSFKARLYTAKAYKESGESDKLKEKMKELEEMFPQHGDLIEYFLNKKDSIEDMEETDEINF